MKKIIILILITFASITSADFLDAGEAYEQKNYPKALIEYQAIANLGHHEAQHNLAVMHFLGQGTEKNLVQAYAWAALATQSDDKKLHTLQGEIKNQLNEEQLKDAQQLAETLEQQYGQTAIEAQLAPPINKTDKKSDDEVSHSSDFTLTLIKQKAPKYPKSALSKGIQGWVKVSFEINPNGSIRRPVIIDSFPKGEFDEATLRAIRGFRFTVNYKEGVDPYPVTATQSIIYEMGGQKKYLQSYQKRLEELQSLADQGHPDAHYYLAMAIDENSPIPVSSDWPADQVAINDHLFKAAQSGHFDAQYHLGNNLYSGTDGYQDKDKGLRWLMTAAENGQAQAARRLSLIFKANPEMNQTEHPAQYWLIQAAEQGELDAKLDYAEWLADNGDNPAQFQQALDLLDDYASDRPETVLWYQTAATLNQKSGNDKKAQKYTQKADKLAKRMGWEE